MYCRHSLVSSFLLNVIGHLRWSRNKCTCNVRCRSRRRSWSRRGSRSRSRSRSRSSNFLSVFLPMTRPLAGRYRAHEASEGENTIMGDKCLMLAEHYFLLANNILISYFKDIDSE